MDFSHQQRGLNDLAYEKIFLTKRRVRDVWTSILASFGTFVTRLHFPEGVSFGRDNFLPSAPQNLGFSCVACLSLVISARKICEMLEICCLWYCTIIPHTSCVTPQHKNRAHLQQQYLHQQQFLQKHIPATTSSLHYIISNPIPYITLDIQTLQFCSDVQNPYISHKNRTSTPWG